jgi:NodT family efflux transporter outer membrane factor (OMF) lipoprotein
VKRLLPLPALLLALLAACTVGPDYERPSAPVSETFRETPSDWKEAQPNDAIERGKWWEMFGDAELNALVEKVEVSNQSLAASEAQFRQALAAITAARAPLFPTLDADVSVTKARSPTGVIGGLTAGRVVTQRSASVAANWEIDLWGRIRRGVEAAEASAYASSGDLASARLSLQAQLITSYFQLRLIDVQKNLLDDTVAAFRRSLELTSNRYAAGVAAKVDVVQADQQVKSTLAQAADLGVQRAQLEHAIAVLTGVAPAQLSIAPRPAYDVAMPVIPPGLPSSLLERRPDVAAAERRMAAANAQIGVAKAAYFPQLTLNAQYGFRSTDVETWFTAPSHFWSFGPALAQSLFDAGLRAAQTEQARAAYDATVATYRQTALTALQDVEDNLAALRILEEEAKLQSDALAAARLSVQLTLNQYKAGTVSFLNVVVVQAAQLNEERNAVAILNRRLAASVSLVRAIGGGWKRDY